MVECVESGRVGGPRVEQASGSKCKQTHRCILHLDFSQREVGMVATSLHGGDENVRERERKTVTLIVCIVSTLYST